MYYGDPDTIQIHAKGITETEFSSASFFARIIAQGKTGPAAKEQIVPIIEKLKKTILGHAESASIDTSRLKTTFDVVVDQQRNTGEFIGYKAVYTIQFTGKNVIAAPAVHDALTSIESVQAETPIYNVDDSAEVHARAFDDAATKAQIKFEHQCKAVHLNPQYYVIKSWAITEEQPRGKTLSFREGATAKPVGMEPGKASLEMRVDFTYGLKQLKAN
jgi:uncharacterized protein YggE